MRSLTTLSDIISFPKGGDGEACADERVEQSRNNVPKVSQSRSFGIILALMLAVFLSGLHYGGYFERVRQFSSAIMETYFLSAGIVLQEIHIKGQLHLEDKQIIKALGIRSGQSLFGFDALKAQKQLSSLGPVKSARVMRLLPSKLLVEIEERPPFARWMHDGRVDLIDKEGVVLRRLADVQQSHYPLVVGAGAERRAAALIRVLSTHPGLAGHIKLAERVGRYRWNLLARNGALIKLPPVNIALAIARFVSLPDWQTLLTSKKLVVDLRQSSQVFVNRQANPLASSQSKI